MLPLAGPLCLHTIGSVYTTEWGEGGVLVGDSEHCRALLREATPFVWDQILCREPGELEPLPFPPLLKAPALLGAAGWSLSFWLWDLSASGPRQPCPEQTARPPTRAGWLRSLGPGNPRLAAGSLLPPCST